MVYPLNAPLVEFLILSIMQNKDSYGYEISQQLKQIANMKDSSLYPVLRRLQEDSLIETYDQLYQGRNRKYYRITDPGRDRLQFLKEEWEKYTDSIHLITDGRDIHD